MFGKFLLGAGLGVLLGSTALALLSITLPPPSRVSSPLAEATKGTATAEGERAAKVPVSLAPEPAPEKPVEPVENTAAPAVPEATAPVPTEKAPQTDSQAPALAKAPESHAGSDRAPSALEPASAARPAPQKLEDTAAEEEPKTASADSPAAPPSLAAPKEPVVPAKPLTGDPAPDLPGGSPLPEISSPATPLEPVQTAEAAPEVAGPLPEPPPLTAEEEAMLAEWAAKGVPAEGEFVVTDPPAAPEGGVSPPPGASATASPYTAAQPLEAASAPKPEVTTDRLPRIGGAEDPSAEQSDPAAEAAGDLTPLRAFAAPFANPDGKPRFAILLIDTGAEGIDRASLAALPFALSFAIDPQAEKAAEIAALYRAAGKEVILLATGLPEGAKAGDVEQSFAVMAEALPEAVAVLSPPETGFQSDRPLASLVLPVIEAQGRGLVTLDQGLNAADQIAARSGLPATTIFRDLDSKGEDKALIRRLLDRAAFKAAQEGQVTVLGRTRPETLAALLEWSVEGRAATVALAPLTAVLTKPDQK